MRMWIERILVIAIAFVVLSSMAETQTIGGVVWTYRIADGCADITAAKTSSGADISGAISIPESLGGYSVAKVGVWSSSVFYGCTGISSVVFPDSVTEIGRYVFYGCTGLRTVTFGSGLKVIGVGSFNSCSGLREVLLPSGIEIIGDNAFAHCSLLKSIDIPDSVVSVGSGAFAGCKGATRLKLSSSLSSIAESAFAECYGIRSVVIPDNVASIESQAFAGCVALETVTIGDGIVSIGSRAFGKCSSSSGWHADFDVGCTNLQSIFFSCYYEPYMGDCVFGYDNGLSSSLPANCVAYVVSSAGGWDATIPGEWNGIQIRWLDSYPIQPEEPYPEEPDPASDELMALTNGRCWRFIVNEGKATIIGMSPTSGEIVIPSYLVVDGVEYPVSRIGTNVFANATDLTEITIPECIESISPSAFSGCDKLWASWFKRLASGIDTGSAGAGDTSAAETSIVLTVTNVVVHYVTASKQSDMVTPPESTGLVNVIAEVTPGVSVSIPSTWADRYSGFVTKFGSDFSAALMKPTGKRDGSGNAMLVWQDFVAGTDPTNPDDKFSASIMFDSEGKPVLSWTPELSASEAGKRIYRKFGKVRLNDNEWTLIDGDEGAYNFFRVTVEMR